MVGITPLRKLILIFSIFFFSAIYDECYHNLSLVKLCKNFIAWYAASEDNKSLFAPLHKYNLCNRACRAPSWLISFISRWWLQRSEIRNSLVSGRTTRGWNLWRTLQRTRIRNQGGELLAVIWRMRVNAK